MPADTESRLRDELASRLTEVAECRQALEAQVRDELSSLQDEEARLRGALDALKAPA